MDPSYYGGRDAYTQMRMRQFEQCDGYDPKADTRPRVKSRGRAPVEQAERPPLWSYYTDQGVRGPAYAIEERREPRSQSKDYVGGVEHRGRDFTRARDRVMPPVRESRPVAKSYYTDQGAYGPGYAIPLRGGGNEIDERSYRPQSKHNHSSHRLYNRRTREDRYIERDDYARGAEYSSRLNASSNSGHYEESFRKSGAVEPYGNEGGEYGRYFSGDARPPRGESYASGYAFEHGSESRGRLRKESAYDAWEYGAM
ncbi:hypothetical protein Slin15195_G104150 [Septoria linicola]|uniref:Uncharacterized protein n=1 Tax=Septoria linicola TaxID=215465 RepID=A0A9Q9B4M0_9PEZI|nr:hypothetical protein Slin14017_G067190 [Septoria linicola]USW57096.1 hypothetical protein Slin15195_G104150 [Septoria linicola]